MHLVNDNRKCDFQCAIFQAIRFRYDDHINIDYKNFVFLLKEHYEIAESEISKTFLTEAISLIEDYFNKKMTISDDNR